jgi:hypothetical protein
MFRRIAMDEVSPSLTMSGRGGAGFDDFFEAVLAAFRPWLADVVPLVVEVLGGMLGVVYAVVADMLGCKNPAQFRGVTL